MQNNAVTFHTTDIPCHFSDHDLAFRLLFNRMYVFYSSFLLTSWF